MGRARAFNLIGLVAVLVAMLPIVAALLIARHQGLSQEYERVHTYAQEVAYRSDRAVVQMSDALARMVELAPADPCSDDTLATFQRLGLEREYIIGVGYVSDDRMPCSTLGIHEPPFDLGPVDLVTPNGNFLRLDVIFPLIEDTSIIALQREAFVVFAHRTQALDLTVQQEGVLFATFTPGLPGLRTWQGDVNPLWPERLGDDSTQIFVEDGYVVAVTRSEQYASTGAIAAVPLAAVTQRVQQFSLLLMPVALLVGLALALSLVYLARYQMSLPSQIRMGLKRREFYLVYQPVVDLESRRWVGVEALLRWRRPNGEIVYPDSFIPIAEESDLINQITERVIELAGRDMTGLMQKVPDLYLSLNLSARDVDSKITPTLLGCIVQKFGGENRVVAEVTERMLVAPDASLNVALLRSAGVRVAIDDFGTGYSSLSYLENMQFDFLKIDKLFVEAIDTEAATHRVVLHIIKMAKTLHLELIAEGVETEKQAQFLMEHGVRYAQGWLFARAMPVDELYRIALQQHKVTSVEREAEVSLA